MDFCYSLRHFYIWKKIYISVHKYYSCQIAWVLSILIISTTAYGTRNQSPVISSKRIYLIRENGELCICGTFITVYLHVTMLEIIPLFFLQRIILKCISQLTWNSSHHFTAEPLNSFTHVSLPFALPTMVRHSIQNPGSFYASLKNPPLWLSSPPPPRCQSEIFQSSSPENSQYNVPGQLKKKSNPSLADVFWNVFKNQQC